MNFKISSINNNVKNMIMIIFFSKVVYVLYNLLLSLNPIGINQRPMTVFRTNIRPLPLNTDI